MTLHEFQQLAPIAIVTVMLAYGVRVGMARYLHDRIKQLRDHNLELQAENERLRDERSRLERKVQELEGRVNELSVLLQTLVGSSIERRAG